MTLAAGAEDEECDVMVARMIALYLNSAVNSQSLKTRLKQHTQIICTRYSKTSLVRTLCPWHLSHADSVSLSYLRSIQTSL